MCVKIMYFEWNVVAKLRKIINFGTTFSVCVWGGGWDGRDSWDSA